MRWARIAVAGLVACVLAARSFAAEASALLADAAERQDFKIVGSLLEQHAEVNSAQVDGMTALHWAVYHDNAAVTELLLRAGADAKAANRYGVTPLSIACTNGNAAIVELLLEAGADPNTALPGGETVLMTAARTGYLRPVKSLIDRGADVNAKEQKGQTALMWAAAEGNLEVVNALIEAEADIRAKLDSGFTPLFFAVREGRTDVALALLKAGIDVNDAMRPGKRAADRSAKGVSALVLAVENAHFELASALLDAGADPDDQRSGFTALHTISWVRKPNSGDEGQAPPVGSGKLSSLQFVRKLVEHGGDVNARVQRGKAGAGELNKKGATPFLLAADTADVPLMKLLVELGADPLLTNADGCTPLLAAAGIGTLAPGEEAGSEAEALEAAQLALDLGGDINAVDNNGETAMHGAAYKSLPKMVHWLVDHGAREEAWNHKNKHGWTPLLIAQGYRPGNFKPAQETIDALQEVMSAEALSAAEPPPKRANSY